MKTIFIFVLLFSAALHAQSSIWDWGGYAKNLLSYMDGNLDYLPFEMGQWQNTAQARLNLFAYPTDALRGTLQSRNLFVYQKNIKQSNAFAQLFSTDSYYFDLTYEHNDKDNIYIKSEIDRLNLSYTTGNLETVLGRQRIAWGACMVWNPTDLFNPFDILDFDYEERPGADALRIQYYTGPLSQIGLAMTPGRTAEQVIYAGRYVMNYYNYDITVLAGWQRKSPRIGFSWAGQLYDGGFRGEILYTDARYSFRTINPDYDPKVNPFDFWINRDITGAHWMIALSYDYTFSNSFYLHTEYLYNSLGATENAAFRRYDILFTGELSPARQSLFQNFGYQFTPLLRGECFIIFNPNDLSWIAAPSIQYSIAQNWETYFLAFPSGGNAGTEYGGYPSQYFARIKFSF